MSSHPRSLASRARLVSLAYLGAWLLAGGCAPRDPKLPAPSAEAVTFAKLPPRIGRTAIEENATEFRLDIDAKATGRAPNRVRTESVEREVRREEILGVFDRVVTRKRISYEKIERTETRNGSPVPVPPSPLLGHSYVVELKQSVLVFSRVDGAPVSGDEERELAKRSSTLGKPDPFIEGLPDGPVYPGAPAPAMAGGFLELFEGADEANRDGPDIANVDVRFAGVREEPQGRCGVFSFTLVVQMAGEPRLGLELKGEFVLRISDSAPIRLEARGPARLRGLQVVEGVSVDMSGAGEMVGTLRVTYL